MPFNSNSYHRNRYRRVALEKLALAREAKALGAAADVAYHVRSARLDWRLYLSYLRMKQCDDDLAAVRAGRMKHAEFMAKWSNDK